MTFVQDHIIGTPGIPWGLEEKKMWLDQQTIKRSYQEQVVAKIQLLKQSFPEQLTIEQYGALSRDPNNYTLWVIKTKHWQADKPNVLVTGGVHGYETSGVQGALRFVESTMVTYADRFNFIVAPCLSPWGYETVNRWTPDATDPNRSFTKDTQVEECHSLMTYVANLNLSILCHIDLHETTDTDNSEFRPALCARDNVIHEVWDIPDGFYLVGDTLKPVDAFQKHIINAVGAVTHIADADDDGRLIGEKISQHGVINYATKELGLCTGFSDCEHGTTTEVYPDSPKVDDENCIQAQVTAVCSGLDYCSNL
jgi:hypothetical protein